MCFHERTIFLLINIFIVCHSLSRKILLQARPRVYVAPVSSFKEALVYIRLVSWFPWLLFIILETDIAQRILADLQHKVNVQGIIYLTGPGDTVKTNRLCHRI